MYHNGNNGNNNNHDRSGNFAIENRRAACLTSPVDGPGQAITPYHPADPRTYQVVHPQGRQGLLRPAGFYGQPSIRRPMHLPDPRFVTPDLMSDGCHDPVALACDKGRVTPPWVADSASCDIARVVNDYDDVGSVGQLRASLKTLYGIGQFDQTRRPMVLAGATATAIFPVAETPLAIGVRIDWAVTLLNSAAFDLQIVLAGWRTPNVSALATGFDIALQNVNRAFTVRVGSGQAGGTIFVPFATRPTGMGNARVALGVPASDVATEEAIVRITGIPAAFTANSAFSSIASSLCAHHPDTAAYARAVGAFDPAQIAA